MARFLGKNKRYIISKLMAVRTILGTRLFSLATAYKTTICPLNIAYGTKLTPKTTKTISKQTIRDEVTVFVTWQ